MSLIRSCTTPAIALPLLFGAPAAPVAAADQVTAPPPSSSGQVHPADAVRIVLDGRFDDWADVPVAIHDPPDAAGAEIDFGRVFVQSDDHFLHLLIELGRPVNPQALDGRMLLLLDADANPETGAERHGLRGVDVVLEFSPPDPRRPDAPGQGVRLFMEPPPDPAEARGRATGVPANAAGVAFAPTFAHDRIELRIDRDFALPGRRRALATPGAHAMRLVSLSPDGAVADETGTFHARFRSAASPPPHADASFDPAKRAEGTAFRVANWNVELGKIMTEAVRSRRLLSAIRADIILLQELREGQAAEPLADLLRSADPMNRPWNVIIGEGGGNLRCAVASHFPMRAGEGISRIAELDATTGAPRPGRFLRQSGVEIDTPAGTILAMSLHLKCCGRLGDDSDRRREREAAAILHALRTTLAAGHGTGRIIGVVVGGDFNLVGGERPLRILVDDERLPAGPLRAAAPMQPCRRTMATWFEPASPFTAGRLDYVLYSGGTLALLHTFVLQTESLAEVTLTRAGLERDDTTRTSDHLPVVVDLARHHAAGAVHPAPPAVDARPARDRGAR